jgi:hypothetical protein
MNPIMLIQDYFSRDSNQKIIVGTTSAEIFEISDFDGANAHRGPVSLGECRDYALKHLVITGRFRALWTRLRSITPIAPEISDSMALAPCHW